MLQNPVAPAAEESSPDNSPSKRIIDDIGCPPGKK